MEPGHEDREYSAPAKMGALTDEASMEPGHEDREYCRPPPAHSWTSTSLNGARP